jgi:competence protein ComEC
MDDIQRKLALVDRQLAGGMSIWKNILATAPLFFAATGLIAGILIENMVDLSSGLWMTLLACCAIGTFLLFAARKNTMPLHVIAIAATICFLCLGAIRLDSFYKPEPDNIRNFVSEERKLATIRGLIFTEPYVNDYGFIVEPNQSEEANDNANKKDTPKYPKFKYKQWQFAKFMHKDPSSSFYLKIKEIKTVGGWAKISGTVRAQVDEPILDLQAGDYIQADCWLQRFSQPSNPGQFDIATYLARRNVYIAAFIKTRESIKLLKFYEKSTFTKLIRTIREKATCALLDNQSTENPGEGLLQALLLGYRGNIDNETYEAFEKTGLLHLISLSGMHLGILIGIIWWLSKTAGLMKRGRAIICIIAIGIFLLIVPPRAPTVRAAIIGWVFCASFLFRRRFNSLNTLSLAAIILLLIRPTQLFEAGWQLSFASVLGLLLLCKRIHFFLYERISGLSRYIKATKTKPFFRIIPRPGQYLLRLFSTGFTAWIGGAGILLYHFYTINLLTSIWTIIVFPSVALILTIGYLKIILSFLLPTTAWGLGIIVTGLADLLIRVVKLIAHLDISQILIGHVPIAPIILYYCLIFFAAFVYFRRPLLKRVVCAVMALLLIVFLGVTKWQRTHRDKLILTCLDVGHGQAILAQTPGKANILFDAGSLSKGNVGRRIAVPFLNYMGISNVDAIVISHNDIDHINGIPEIVESCEVKYIYADEAFIEGTDRWGTAKFLNDFLAKKDLTIQRIGESLYAGYEAKINVLWPGEQTRQFSQLSDNDKSLVSLIKFAGRKLLLCSDIEEFAQTELMHLYPELKADIVVVPHHGSVRTSTPDFIRMLDAEILLCSCGKRQYENMSDATRQTSKGKQFYTPIDGAITAKIEKTGTIKTTTYTQQKEP